MATLDWTTNKASIGAQAQRPQYFTRWFDFSGNLPAGTTAKLTTCDTTRLFKIEPNSLVIDIVTKICTGECVAASATFGITGSCLSDADGLDALVCLTKTGAYAVGIKGTDVALLKSTGKCAAYITMYNCQAVCAAVLKVTVGVVREADHT